MAKAAKKKTDKPQGKEPIVKTSLSPDELFRLAINTPAKSIRTNQKKSKNQPGEM